MANRVPTLLATAVAAACSLSAHANGPTQADYAKVVLYSNVTIAQDSSSQWGIWEELEPTAAGPQTPLPLLAGTTELYRPVGTVNTDASTPPQTLSDKGVPVGFGVISNYNNDYGEEARAQAFMPISYESSRAGFTLEISDASEATVSGSWQPLSMKITTALVRSDITETSHTYEGLGPLVHDGSLTHRFNNIVGEELYENYNLSTDTSQIPSETTAGQFLGDITIVRYVAGQGEFSKNYYEERSSNVYGVWGVTTSAQDMNNLRQSNAQASYAGTVFDQDGGYNGSVSMKVNFGTSEFSANIRNVGGGQVSVGNNTAIGISEKLTFDVSGTISGERFAANKLSPGVTGQFVGAFFGPQAAAAGGVLDVSAVPNAGIPSGPRPVTRYVAPFIAIKGASDVGAPK
jgi:hypothetical protein